MAYDLAVNVKSRIKVKNKAIIMRKPEIFKLHLKKKRN